MGNTKITGEEFFAQTGSDEYKEQEKLHLGIKKDYLIVLLSILVFVFVFFSIRFIGKKHLEDTYQSYRSSYRNDMDLFGELSKNLDLLQYDDSHLFFEKTYLGNLNSYLLSYGKILELENPNLRFMSKDNKLISLTEDQKEKIIIEEPVSYINAIQEQDMLFFRKDSDRRIYISRLDGTDQEIFIEDRTGESLLYKNKLYYINYSDGGKLYFKNLKGHKAEKVIDDKLLSFGVLGDKIVFLTDEHSLMVYDIDDNSINRLQNNIEKFILTSQIIAKNNGNIISFSLENDRAQKYVSGVDDFVGSNDVYIYYTVNTDLRALNLNNGEHYVILEDCGICKAVYMIDDEFYVVTEEKTDNGVYREQLKKVKEDDIREMPTIP